MGDGKEGKKQSDTVLQVFQRAVWGATATGGHACGSLHRVGAGERADRAEEFGLRHGSLGLSGRGPLRRLTGLLRPEVGRAGKRRFQGAKEPVNGAKGQPITRSTGRLGEADWEKNRPNSSHQRKKGVLQGALLSTCENNRTVERHSPTSGQDDEEK